MITKVTLEKLETVIEKAKPEDQRRFLVRLPRLLKMSSYDMALLKLAEPSFDFWNNIDDAVYDYL